MTLSNIFFTCLISFTSLMATLFTLQETRFAAYNENNVFFLKPEEPRRRDDSSSSYNQSLRLNKDSTEDVQASKRIAPYELDTTQYKINTDKIVQNWRNAQNY
mmetsp:Transcript_9084/g.10393  ORF Transcript_9084/g.10393 Transcript_9084/m.10393 type:complete len:103 (+) Transcript_9084:112-420(+)